MKKFARKCDECGELFNEGYILNDGDEYFCSKKCVNQKYSEKEFKELLELDLIYFTEWEDEEDFEYYEDGSEVEE